MARVRGLRGRTDRDRHLVLVTKGDLVRIAVKPFRSGIVGSASVGPALAGRLARDSQFAVFLAALRGLRLAGLTGRLARLFDPVIDLDPAVIPAPESPLPGSFGSSDTTTVASTVPSSGFPTSSGTVVSGAVRPGPPGLRNRGFRLVSVLRAGRERVFPGGGDAPDRE